MRIKMQIERKFSLMLLLMLSSLVFLTGCNTKCKFDGLKVVDENGFRMDYSILDKTEEAVLSLSKGDELEVDISQKKGVVSVLVCVDGREPVYKGSDLGEAHFTLIIPESGDYNISVTGHRSQGLVLFFIKHYCNEVSK